MMQLRGYQVDAVEAITVGLAGGGRGQAIAACGTGKTLVGLRAALRLCPPGGLVAIAAPSLALVAQTLKLWVAEQAADRLVAVCSDQTIRDVPVRLGDLPCPVTTDRNQIAAWLRAPTPGRRLLVTTHASAGVAGAGIIAADATADLLLVDEAHETAGPAAKQAAVLHDNTRFPAARRLYMTATPRYLPSARARGGGDHMIGMDDPDVFGPVLFSYPFGAAIDDGWLDDYRVAAIGVTHAEVLATLRNLDDTSLRTAVIQTALARAVAQFDLRRIVAFTPTITLARQFARTLPGTLRQLPDAPDRHLTSAYVDGRMSIAQRDAILDDLRKPPNDGMAVIANARCLIQGIDVPAIDAALFTHPKKSTIEVIQAVGRALRRNPDGTGLAIIIVPVLLPDCPDQAAVNDEDEFKTLWQVLRALRAHDTSLGAALDHARIGHAAASDISSAHPDLPGRILLQLPDGYDTHYYLRHIRVRLLENTTSDWLASYAAAYRYHAQHGHLRVPDDLRVDGILLATWLKAQRVAHRRGALPPDRVAMLEKLAIQWEPRDRAWDVGLAAATKYYRQHRHLRVPRGTRVDGLDLSVWVWHHTRRYQAGRLSRDRVAALERLHIDWNPGQRGQRQWRQRLAAVRAFREQHGHLRIPPGTRAAGVDIAMWLHKQTKAYRNGELAADRAAELTQLGVAFTRADRWHERLAAVRAFYEQHGHLRIPHGTRAAGVKLAMWLHKQTKAYRDGELAADRAAQLTQLGITRQPHDMDEPAKERMTATEPSSLVESRGETVARLAKTIVPAWVGPKPAGLPEGADGHPAGAHAFTDRPGALRRR